MSNGKNQLEELNMIKNDYSSSDEKKYGCEQSSGRADEVAVVYDSYGGF